MKLNVLIFPSWSVLVITITTIGQVFVLYHVIKYQAALACPDTQRVRVTFWIKYSQTISLKYTIIKILRWEVPSIQWVVWIIKTVGLWPCTAWVLSTQADLTAYRMCIKTPVDMQPNLARSTQAPRPSAHRLQFRHTCYTPATLWLQNVNSSILGLSFVRQKGREQVSPILTETQHDYPR